MELGEPQENHKQVPRRRHFPGLLLMDIQLIHDRSEQLPERVVLELISHHRPGSDAWDHLGVVCPDERIDPEERVALARYPQFLGDFLRGVTSFKNPLAIK